MPTSPNPYPTPVPGEPCVYRVATEYTVPAEWHEEVPGTFTRVWEIAPGHYHRDAIVIEYGEAEPPCWHVSLYEPINGRQLLDSNSVYFTLAEAAEVATNALLAFIGGKIVGG